MLTTTVKLPGAEDYDSHMAMHTSTAKTDTSLAREFQKNISYPTWVHGLLNHGKYIKRGIKQK